MSCLISETVIPTLMYLSVKLDQQQIVKLFNLYLALYNSKNYDYQSKLFKLLYACMDEQSLKEVLPSAFLVPTGMYDRMQDSRMEYPSRGYKGFVLTPEMAQIMIDGLKADSYNRKIEAIQRMKIIAENVKGGLSDESLLNAVYELRGQDNARGIALSTYSIVPYHTGKDTRDIATVVYNLVDKLKLYQLDGNHFSQDLFAIRDMLDDLQYVAGELTRYMPDVIDKVVQFMSIYSKQLTSPANHNDFGQSQFIDYFMTVLYRLLNQVDLSEVRADKLGDLSAVVKKLEKDFEVAGINVILMVALNKPDAIVEPFVNGLRIKMYSADRKRRADALNALKYLAVHDYDMGEVINCVYQYLKTSQDSYIHEYIEFLSYLRNNFKLDLSKEILVAVSYLRQRLSDASFSANAKADILYSVSLFLRSIHVRNNDLIKERGEWRKLVKEDPEMFNDVKMAFEWEV